MQNTYCCHISRSGMSLTSQTLAVNKKKFSPNSRHNFSDKRCRVCNSLPHVVATSPTFLAGEKELRRRIISKEPEAPVVTQDHIRQPPKMTNLRSRNPHGKKKNQEPAHNNYSARQESRVKVGRKEVSFRAGWKIAVKRIRSSLCYRFDPMRKLRVRSDAG